MFMINNIFLFIRRDNLCTSDNCLVTEIWSQNKNYFLTCSYHSPSQSQGEFEIFCTNFDILLSQINDKFPLCSIVTGDFNARCTNWQKDDNTNSTCWEIYFLTFLARYAQIIDKPRYVINNSMSCICILYFISCTNQNVISKYGVDLTNAITISSMTSLTSVYFSTCSWSMGLQ